MSKNQRKKQKKRGNTSESSSSSSSSSGLFKNSRPLLEDDEHEIELRIDARNHTFNAENFGKTLQKGFSILYNDHVLSDITVILTAKPSSSSSSGKGKEKEGSGGDGGKGKDSSNSGYAERIPAHRMVLCTWSDVFRGMLTQQSKEGGKMDEVTVELDLADHQHFKNMLKYMYTGSVDFVNNKNVIPLMRLCEHYGVTGLKEVCGELLGAHVSEYNLFFLLDIMERYDCASLNEKCGEFLAQNFDAMLNDDRERMMKLKPATWAVMIKNDNLKVRSEEFLFEAALEFAEQFDEEGKKEEVLAQLLPHIRYSHMAPKYLVEKVEDNEELQSVSGLHEILYETFRLKSYPDAKPKHLNTKPRKGFQGFDENRCAPNMTISNAGQRVSMAIGGWNTVMCKQAFSASHNYIEFKLISGATHMIGVANGTVPLPGNYAGQHSNAWTYYTAAGQIYNPNGNTAGGQTLAAGDTLGIKVDAAKGSMQCYKNGTLQITFNGLPAGSTTLFPVVSSSAAGDCVEIVAGPVYKS